MKFLLTLIVLFLAFNRGNAQSIQVLFNQSVNTTVSSLTDAQTSLNLDDTIKKLIDESQTTLDIAVWDNGSTVIVNAINAAYLRGVQVRYITSSNALNSALSGLHASIPVLERNSGISSNVMHNKFVIVDDQKLLMGSMNFGNGSMFDDFNNIVLISDANLASTYTAEFNEMWGTNGAQPNLTNSKFGPDKTNNTTHNFTIDGSAIESYFSPTDNTTLEIVNAINSADFTLDIAMFTFINNDIGDAVIAAKQRGVIVRCIIENVSYFGSEYNGLISAGIPVISHDGIAFDFHHKYCIIDAFQSSSDPQVVTGSHNWTNSAEQEYDENTLIFHNLLIAQQYTEEFTQRWIESGGSGVDEQNPKNTISIYPNPSTGTFQLLNCTEKIEAIEIYNLSGELIENRIQHDNSNTFSFDIPNGIYLVRIKTGDDYRNAKLLIE